MIKFLNGAIKRSIPHDKFPSLNSKASFTNSNEALLAQNIIQESEVPGVLHALFHFYPQGDYGLNSY